MTNAFALPIDVFCFLTITVSTWNPTWNPTWNTGP